MTAPPQQSAGAVALGDARAPAWVRHGSSKVQQDYRVALGFEQMLLDQLTSEIAGAGLSPEGEEGAEGGQGSAAGGGELSALAAQALSQSLSAGGGLGLAAQLTAQLDGKAARGAGASGAAGGTPA